MSKLHFQDYDWMKNSEFKYIGEVKCVPNDPILVKRFVSIYNEKGYCSFAQLIKNASDSELTEFLDKISSNPNIAYRFLIGLFTLCGEGAEYETKEIPMDFYNAYVNLSAIIFLHIFCKNYVWIPNYENMSVFDTDKPVIKHLTVNDFAFKSHEERIALLEKTLL